MSGLFHIKTVRYIKLGSARQALDESCISDGEAFVGFGTDKMQMFELVMRGDFEAYRQLRLVEEMERVRRGEISEPAARSNATSSMNQVKSFVTAGEDTLWFTFYEGRLHWAVLADERPVKPDASRGIVRKVVGGWSDKDLAGETLLTFDTLSGRLTRTAAYRSTTCEISEDAMEYLKRRLAGQIDGAAKHASDKRGELLQALVAVIEKFTFKDFELLTELVLTSVGWRRLFLTGSSMPFADLILEQPLDGRRLVAQAKSVLTVTDIEKYAGLYEARYSEFEGSERTPFYFAYHTDRGDLVARNKLPELPAGMKLMGPQEIADLALRAGLTDWIIDKIG